MDYARRERVKLWGRARIVEDDAALLARLTPDGRRARPEHVVVFAIEAWDVNCPQHIPEKLDAEEVRAAMAALQRRLETLEAENARFASRFDPSLSG